jgi:hypothetical protein
MATKSTVVAVKEGGFWIYFGYLHIIDWNDWENRVAITRDDGPGYSGLDLEWFSFVYGEFGCLLEIRWRCWVDISEAQSSREKSGLEIKMWELSVRGPSLRSGVTELQFFWGGVVLQLELRVSHLLDRHSTTWATPLTLFFVLGIFWDRVSQTICLGCFEQQSSWLAS